MRLRDQGAPAAITERAIPHRCVRAERRLRRGLRSYGAVIALALISTTPAFGQQDMLTPATQASTDAVKAHLLSERESIARDTRQLMRDEPRLSMAELDRRSRTLAGRRRQLDSDARQFAMWPDYTAP